MEPRCAQQARPTWQTPCNYFDGQNFAISKGWGWAALSQLAALRAQEVLDGAEHGYDEARGRWRTPVAAD